MNKLRGTYQRVEKEYTLSVDYTYYWEDVEWDYSGSKEIEVTEAYIDSHTIPLEFYLKFIHHQIEEDIGNHAHDNR